MKTKSVSAAKASPLAPPSTVSLELGSSSVKVTCPITARAAWPVRKSAAKTAAAERKKTEIHFMRNVVDTFKWLADPQL